MEYLEKKKIIILELSKAINKNPKKNFGNIIVACAKQENDYINDWIKYHLDLGFDNIFLFDNNDLDYEDVSSRIDDDLKNRVYIMKIPGLEQFQSICYDNTYHYICHQFEWVLFIDIDEFLFINPNIGKLKDLLSTPLFKNNSTFQLAWKVIGDDGIIEGDKSIPVYKRLKYVSRNNVVSPESKCIARGGDENAFMNVHCISSSDKNSKLNIHMLTDGTINKASPARNVSKQLYDIAWINHYQTKTLSEYLESKYGRKDAAKGPSNRFNLETYFFRINKDTPEKRKYIEKFFKNKQS